MSRPVRGGAGLLSLAFSVLLRYNRANCGKKEAFSVPSILDRMEENLAIFDFALTDREMESIAAMDIGHSEIIDHRCYCTARQLNSVKIHA